ncbi:MAG: PAS domain S-box protein [Betaproteobacteria bacterium]|nr:PAS domain S-box protein [Betaproteobacteria bacterium]
MLDGVITIDPDGRIASLNQAACRLFGYTSEEVLGTQRHDAHPRTAQTPSRRLPQNLP